MKNSSSDKQDNNLWKTKMYLVAKKQELLLQQIAYLQQSTLILLLSSSNAPQELKDMLAKQIHMVTEEIIKAGSLET